MDRKKREKQVGQAEKTKDIPFAVAENLDNLSHNWVYRSVSLVCPVCLGCRMADDWRRHMTKITAIGPVGSVSGVGRRGSLVWNFLIST